MTTIEWTRSPDGTEGKTWNPVSGCSKVSTGCKNCYAERVFPRVYTEHLQPYPTGDKWEKEGIGRPRRFTDIKLHPDRLTKPLHWRKPRRVFVNSMSDLFHEDVPDEFIDKVFAVMALSPQHTYQVLTKRPKRMQEYMVRLSGMLSGSFDLFGRSVGFPPRNVWLGVSCEDQRTADERIPVLLQTPAAIRFVSAEPLLGPIDFARIQAPGTLLDGFPDGLGWMICGGESGPKARAMDLAWARSIVEQCKAAGTPVFVKQLGRNPYCEGCGDLIAISGARDPKGGDPSEWPEDLRVREYPNAA